MVKQLKKAEDDTYFKDEEISFLKSQVKSLESKIESLKKQTREEREKEIS